MNDVKARLAAAGWSDRTRGGYEIVEWLQNGVCGFVGIVRDGHLLGCMEWSDTGGNTDVEDGESVWDLVPLTAPVAVQDEQPEDNCPVQPHVLDGILYSRWGVTPDQGKRMARELIAARKRIAELEDEFQAVSVRVIEWMNRCTDTTNERDELLDQLVKSNRQREELLDQLAERDASLAKYVEKCRALELEKERLQCPPVQKLATSGPSITRPVPAVDAWVTYGRPMGAIRWRVSGIETADGHSRIICGPVSLNASDDMLTGPSDRGPWRPIGEVR